MASTPVYGKIKELDIERSTLDTDDIVLTVTQKKSPVDVTGWTANLTVNPNKDATDAGTNVFEATGSPLTPATNGQIAIDMTSFAVSAGNYNYDIRIIDAAGKGRESLAGKFKVVQRIPSS